MQLRIWPSGGKTDVAQKVGKPSPVSVVLELLHLLRRHARTARRC